MTDHEPADVGHHRRVPPDSALREGGEELRLRDGRSGLRERLGPACLATLMRKARLPAITALLTDRERA